MKEQQKIMGKEFDQWVLAGRDESMEQGHFEATMQLFSLLANLISAKKNTDLSIDTWIRSCFDQKSIFDIGCGNGWAVRKFIDMGGLRGYGCDLSSKMIEKAQQCQNYNIQYHVGDIDIFSQYLKKNTLPKPNICICIESLYYHIDPKLSVAAMYNILESDGFVGIMVDLYEESWGTHPWIDALNVDVHLLSINAYKSLLQEAGFVNVEHMQFHMTSPATPKSDFICTDYWPTYEHYLAYRQAGSLLLIGQKIK